MKITRYFILGPAGFARFDSVEGFAAGELWVRHASEKKWNLAGGRTCADIAADIELGLMVEFSPGSLLGGSVSVAKVSASRMNGAKGGRPRKGG